jgi:hypothetical protein
MAETYLPDDLKALADALDDIAAALPFDAHPEHAGVLNDYGRALGGAASNLRLFAVQQYLAETEEPLANVVAATQALKDSIRTIDKYERAIDLVQDVLILGNVVWMKKWSLVAPAAKALRADMGPGASGAARAPGAAVAPVAPVAPVAFVAKGAPSGSANPA